MGDPREQGRRISPERRTTRSRTRGDVFGTDERTITEAKQQPSMEAEVFHRRPDLREQLLRQTVPLLEAAGRTPEEIETVLKISTQYLDSRYKRGKELDSVKVERARHLAQLYFDEAIEDEVSILLDLCMDRRTRKTLITGIPGGFGGSLRSPGGRPEGFHRNGFGEELYLDPNSEFGGTIERTMKKNPHVVLVVDSHHGCARVNDFETGVRGEAPRASGVGIDRRYKGNMIKAINRFIQERNLGKLTTLQVSFDPTTGYLDLLDEEKYEDTVLSTNTVAEELKDIFDQHTFPIDWLNDYENSALSFWQNILQLQSVSLPKVRNMLHKVYPNLSKDNPEKFELKARLALVSAFSGYLNTVSGDGKYPHNYHSEDLVVALSGGEHGPFREAEAFEIPRSGIDFRTNAQYATNLVRRYRQEGNPTTPVPLILQYRVNAPHTMAMEDASLLTEEISRDIAERDWNNMSYQDLIRYVIHNFPGVDDRQTPADYAASFADLVMDFVGIYSRDVQDEFRESIYTGAIVPIAVLTDKNGAPFAIFPLHPQVRKS